MMQKALFCLLKALACLVFTFLYLPFFAAISASFGLSVDSRFLFERQVWMAIPLFIGMAYKALLYPRIQRHGVLGLVAANALGILLTLFFAWAGWRGASLLSPALVIGEYAWASLAGAITFGVFCGGYFLTGNLLWEQNYGNILTYLIVWLLTGFDAVCLFLSWALKWNIPSSYLAFCFLFFICVYAFIKNQSNIDYLMERRKHDLRHLPPKMRQYSLSLVAGVFAIILLGFLCRDLVAKAIHWLLNLLRMGIGALLRLLPRGEEGAPEAVPDPSTDGGMDLSGLGQGKSSIFWTIFGWAIFLLILWLLFYYRHELLNLIRGLLRKCSAFLRRTFLRRAAHQALHENQGYYQDEVEDLVRESEPETITRKKSYDRKRFRKECRVFHSMPDGTQKQRFGYRLALQHLLLERVSLTSSDTPEEILKKAGEKLPKDLLACFGAVTEDYSLIRYDERETEEGAIRRLTELLERVSN